MGCEKHGIVGQTASVVNGICPKGCNFDGKSMVAIGLLRWFFNLQREENQLVFEIRGTDISTGEISNLSEDFLLRFYALHRRHIPKLKTLFESNGGMIHHNDGTGEAGDDIVFSTKEGLTGITLDARVMPSESKKYVKPFLENLHDSFGVPVAVLRDMSKQIRDSVSDVFPGVLQLVCHYHFVKNLGKIIFKERYESLRNSMVRTKRLSQLVKLKEKMLHVKSSNSLIMGEWIWTSLSIEYLLQPREQPSGYPFILPYFEIINRAIEVEEMIRCIVRWNADHNLALEAILDLSNEVDGLIKNTDVRIRYFQIKRIFGWFEEVRKILNVSRHLSENEQGDKPVDIKKVEERLEQVLNRIKREGGELGGTYNYAAKSITEQFQNHWNELFAEVHDKKGDVMEVARDNGIEERSHRWSRMHMRRRTGRSRTANDMAKYGALLAVLSNLENKTYVEKVLTDVDDFVYEMQNITPEEIKEAKKLIRPYQHKNLVRSDKKRAVLLHEFVDILKSSEDADEADAELKNWLSKLQNPTTE